MKEKYTYFGRKVQRRREDLRMSRAQLAWRVGVTEQQIYRLELGTNVTLQGAYRVAEALRVPLDNLV